MEKTKISYLPIWLLSPKITLAHSNSDMLPFLNRGEDFHQNFYN